MAYFTYAAIDIGPSKLTMKIYQVSRTQGIRDLTQVRQPISLGSDVYSTGSVSYPTTEEICHTLNDFKRIMKDYGVKDWQVYTTSGLREAKNAMIVIDQIQIQTGFTVKILSNSEARFLYYRALAIKDPNFNKIIEQGTLIADIGGGSVQLSIFDKGKLQATQNLLLGSTRIQELLQAMEDQAYDFYDLIDEYVEKDLMAFEKIYLRDAKIKNLIIMGDVIPELYTQITAEPSAAITVPVDKKTFKKGLKLIKTNSELAKQVTPAIILVRRIAHMTRCEQVLLSRVEFCDSMVAEAAEKKAKLVSSHDFTGDILSASENMARRYKTDMNHIGNVQNLALQFFDKIKKLHGLGRRERLLLQISVILHSCGAYIDSIDTRECSYQIIMSSEIIGLSHKERAMIAYIVRYKDGNFPSYGSLDEDFTRQDYITMTKLNALLRIANVLDKSNRQKIENVSISLKDGQLIVTADTMADITLEQGLFAGKATAFQNIFGVKPVLRQKRSGGRHGQIRKI
ncbi:MAG: exopolyphosphatase [Eubacterium sp.]|nr:exopolyphosphatase [Eubacterium sp.]